MWKTGVAALLSCAVLTPTFAATDSFDQGINTMWEALWHQSGTATRMVRWEKDIKVRVFGTNLAAHKQHVLQALRAAAGEAGVKLTDVSDEPDAAQQANVSIEIVPDSQLSNNQPCETRLNFATETHIDSVVTQMRDSDEWRCAYHESMHVMGVRGHPAGDSVLSYFATQVGRLTRIDKAMLHAWYSPRARGGMTPFELLPIMADELVAMSPDKQKAAQERDLFMARTVKEMEAFADGTGDIPAIVKRSGKATTQGIQYGRMEMSYFLGVAYLDGVTVLKNANAASRWLQQAADMGDQSARVQLAAGGGATLAGSR